MSVKITWPPSIEADIASYIVQRSAAQNGPFATLTTIAHDLLGPNYDSGNSVFFYVDSTGTNAHWYRLIAVDAANQQSQPSAPFQVPLSPSFASLVKLDHNYGSANALAYYTAGGSPIEGAIVRVYTKAQFDLGQTDTPLAITLTNVRGQWTEPVYVTTGFTYVIQFAKEGLYGPNSVEVIV